MVAKKKSSTLMRILAANKQPYWIMLIVIMRKK